MSQTDALVLKVEAKSEHGKYVGDDREEAAAASPEGLNYPQKKIERKRD